VTDLAADHIRAVSRFASPARYNRYNRLINIYVRASLLAGKGFHRNYFHAAGLNVKGE
jgi:hypothetical protein